MQAADARTRRRRAAPAVRSIDQALEELLSDEMRRRMREDVDSLIERRVPHRVNRLSMSEWAEEKRILPAGLTSMPGPFRFGATPYLREIADCFAESSPVQKVAVMKGSRLGFTVGVGENWMGYVIDVAPGPMLFVSADKEVAQAVVETRVDRMIETAGLQGRISAQSEKRHGKKTGDTKSRKDFAGGFLMAIGPNVAAKLRTHGIRYVYADEVDAYPQEVRQEGDPLTLILRRTDEYESIRKVLYTSTPLIDQTSRIKPLFEAGDHRYYHVPCKHCGHMQVLRWDRMKYEADERGVLVWDSVHYECEACGGQWKNADKADFLARGEWRATGEATEPNYRSYHLSALYSPIGMRTWESICQEWIGIKGDPVKLRAFVNTVLGETWVERGEAPRYERVMLRREQYVQGECPGKAYLLTVGADVQADRIEAEIVAWGRDKESWSIGYHVFPGDTSDIDGAAWSSLYELVTSRHVELGVSMALIDAGYNTPQVYQWCERFEAGVYPCMGEARQSRGRRVARITDVAGYQVQRVDLNTDFLKLELYGYLRKGPPEHGELYPPGYCHFPAEYPERYFRMLTAEQRMKETTRTGVVRYVWHLPSGRRNEALDARVYAMGALYVYAGFVSQEEFGGEQIEWRAFWSWCEETFGENG